MASRLFRAIFKALVSIFAILMILIGIIVAPSPIPFGFVFIILGFLLLVAVAPDIVRWLRRHWRWFDRRMSKLEKKLPKWLANQIRKSRTDREEDERD